MKRLPSGVREAELGVVRGFQLPRTLPVEDAAGGVEFVVGRATHHAGALAPGPAAPAAPPGGRGSIGRIADPLAFGHSVNLRVFLQAVVPEDLERGHVAVGGEVVAGDRGLGEHEGAGAFLLDALDADDLALGEMQRHVGRAQDVAGHVAQRAAAEVVEAAPVEGRVEEAAVAIRFGLPPAVKGRFSATPSQRSQSSVAGTGSSLGTSVRPCGQMRAVAPGVDFGDVADLAVPDHLGAWRVPSFE